MNFEGWEVGGEHEAWTTESANVGIRFEYVTFYSKWMLVRVKSVTEAKVARETTRARIVAFIVVCFIVAWFLLHQQGAMSLARKRAPMDKKAQKISRSPKFTRIEDVFKDFRKRCAKVELETSCDIGEMEHEKCLGWLFSLMTEGMKLQAAVIKELDDCEDRRSLVKIQEELATILATLNRQRRDLEHAFERRKLAWLRDDAFLCVVCLERTKCILLLPCAHVCLCEACDVSLHTCPVCRKIVVTKHKVFF
jgi:hypothetical protein